MSTGTRISDDRELRNYLFCIIGQSTILRIIHTQYINSTIGTQGGTDVVGKGLINALPLTAIFN